MNTIAKTLRQLLLVSCLLPIATASQAAVDMFLIIEGVNGESKDSEYPDSIDILAWSEGLSIPVTFDTGGGGSTGKASAQSINITKFIDSASPDLRFNLVRGEVMPSASIIVRQSSAVESYELFRIDLTEVRLDSVSASAASGGDRPTENISLFFTKIRWIYTPVDQTGKPGSKIIRGWDFSKNAAF